MCTLIARAEWTRKGTCPARARKLEESPLRQRLGDRLLSGLSGSDETAKDAGSGRWNQHHAEEGLTRSECPRSEHALRAWTSQPESYYTP